jgi:hypothetical protein
MISMVALVAVVLLVIVTLARWRSAPGERPGTAEPPERVISPAVLDAAVAGGVLAREQADALLRLATPAAPRPREGPRVSVTAEVLGYLGAVLAIIGGVMLVAQFWREMETWSRLALAGGLAAGLTLAGLLVHDETDPILWRLRGFLWLLASAAVALFAGLLGADVFDWAPEPVALFAGVWTTLHAGLLWRRQDRPGQHLACVGGLIAALAAAGAWTDGAAAAGLAVLALGAAWTALGWRDQVPPRLLALVVGPILVLVGAGVTAGSWPDAAPVLGLVAALALVGLGSQLREFLLTATGVVGVFVYVPWTAGQFFADSVGVPIVILLTGALLLAVALRLLLHEGNRSRRPSRPV